MSGEQLRAGVIGRREAPEFDLGAVCDLNPAVLDRFFDRAGVPHGAIREYTDYREMLDRERLDVVSIATPDDYHTEPVCDAAAAGVKGIFCEKPLASSLHDADRIIVTVERYGVKMSVDHTRSWWPSFQALRQAVRAGAIGPRTRIVAHMGGRRAMLFRNGTHIVDAVNYFAEAAPVWVIAAHERGFEDYGTVYRGQGGQAPSLDPGSTLIVEYANGVRGILNGAKRTPAIYELDLFGPGGRYYLGESFGEAGGRAWTTEAPEGPPVAAPVPWSASHSDDLGVNLVPAVRELAQMVTLTHSR